MLISKRMVPTDAVVHFKFKNALETEKFPFCGSSVSVKELKQFINQKHKLDQKSSRPDKSQAPAELSLENAVTGEVYLLDDAEIPKDTVITVARKLAGGETSEPEEPKLASAVPSEVPSEKLVPEKPISGAGDVSYYYNNTYNQYQGQQDPTFEKMGFPGVITESTDISELNDYSEEQKIFAMMYQCLLFYDHTAYVSKPRQTAYCSHCQVSGQHSTKFCPNARDSNVMAGGRRNTQRAPTVAPTTVTTNPAAYASVPDESYEREAIDPDLCCSICKNLLRDAVVAPCCTANYCDACIRTTLMDEGGDSVCPSCGAQLAPDSCTPNIYLRSRVEKWEREMQIKRQQKKKEGSPQSAGSKPIAVKEEKLAPVSKESPLVNTVSSSAPLRQSQPGRMVSVKTETHTSVARVAPSDTHSEAKPIGSLISTTTHKIPPHIPPNLFQQQPPPSQTSTQSQNAQSLASSETRRTSFSNNPQAANITNPYIANARLTGRQPPNPMSFFGMNQFVDGSGFGYLNPAFRNPMSAAASAAAFQMRGSMGNRMPYGMSPGMTPDMSRFPMFAGQQTAEMYERGLRFGNNTQSNILPTGQSLRITRILNQQKVPVQSPYDSESPTRADKLRDKDKEDYRRDKEEDRRRDSKPYDSKYDDRKDRRDDRKKREGSYKSDIDDRRSSERRHSRERRFRNDSRSPDRKDLRTRKDDRKIRSDEKYDRLVEKETRREKRKDDTPKSDKNVSPVSKPKVERADSKVEPSLAPIEPRDKDVEIPSRSDKPASVEDTKPVEVIRSLDKASDEDALKKEREDCERKEREQHEVEKRRRQDQRRRKEKKEEQEKQEWREEQAKRERELDQKAKELERQKKEMERQLQEIERQRRENEQRALEGSVIRKETTPITAPVVRQPVDIVELKKKAFGKWENDHDEDRTGSPVKAEVSVVPHGESVEEQKGYSTERKPHKSRSKKEKKAAKASKEKNDAMSGEIGEKKVRRKHREGDGLEKDRVKRERNRPVEEDVQVEMRLDEEKKDKSGDRRKQKSLRSKRDNESELPPREKRPRSESPLPDRRDEREFKRLDSKTSEFDDGKGKERRSHKDRDDKGSSSRKPSRSKKDKPKSSRSRAEEERVRSKDREGNPHDLAHGKIEDSGNDTKTGIELMGRHLDRISGESERKERSSEKRSHKSSRKRDKSSKEKRSRGESDEKDSRKKHKKRKKRDKKDLMDSDLGQRASAEAENKTEVGDQKSFFSRLFVRLSPRTLRKLNKRRLRATGQLVSHRNNRVKKLLNDLKGEPSVI